MDDDQKFLFELGEYILCALVVAVVAFLWWAGVLKTG